MLHIKWVPCFFAATYMQEDVSNKIYMLKKIKISQQDRKRDSEGVDLTFSVIQYFLNRQHNICL